MQLDDTDRRVRARCNDSHVASPLKDISHPNYESHFPERTPTIILIRSSRSQYIDLTYTLSTSGKSPSILFPGSITITMVAFASALRHTPAHSTGHVAAGSSRSHRGPVLLSSFRSIHSDYHIHQKGGMRMGRANEPIKPCRAVEPPSGVGSWLRALFNERVNNCFAVIFKHATPM